MAPPRDSAPKVEYVHDFGRSEHSIGVRTGGAFVPFATLSDARFNQLHERAGHLSEAEGETGGDDS